MPLSTPRIRRNALRALGLVVVLSGTIPLGLLCANGWVDQTTRTHIHRDRVTVPARTVAIVPGTLVVNGVCHRALEMRLEAARDLHRAGKVQAILVSGNPHEAIAMRAWLTEHGVPSSDIALDPAGYRTLDTMERAARVFRVKSAVVCTQDLHLPRAVFLARQAGIDAVGLVADPRTPSLFMRNRRETLAVTLAVIDSYLLNREAKEKGAIPPTDTASLGDIRTAAATATGFRGR